MLRSVLPIKMQYDVLKKEECRYCRVVIAGIFQKHDTMLVMFTTDVTDVCATCRGI